MQIVNVALPTLSRTFDAPLPDVQWTVIAYLLTLAVVIPASGWIGDRVGTKRTFIFALALFTVASALCGAANSLPELIAARALQGVGGGMLTPTGTAMLYRAYGPEQRAQVARTLILPILIGPGGSTDPRRRPDPDAVVAMGVPDQRAGRHRDAARSPTSICPSIGRRLTAGSTCRGMLLSGVGLSALLYAISEGSVVGWAAPEILVSGLGGIALLWAFAQGALRVREPILRAATAAGATAARNQHRVRADDRRVSRQPLPDTDLSTAGVAPVADRVGHDHVRRGDRRRRRVADPRPALPAARAAGPGRDRRDRPDRVHGAVPARRPRREHVAGPGADVLRRSRQRRHVPVDPDIDVHPHLQRGHRPRVGDLQHGPRNRRSRSTSPC